MNRSMMSNPQICDQKKEETLWGGIYSVSIFVLYIAVIFFVYQNVRTTILQDAEHEELQEIETMTNHVYDVFSRIEVYLVYVSNLYSVRQVLEKETPLMREEAQRFFSKLIEVNVNKFAPTFDQIRLLDVNGMEKIRVDLAADRTASVCQKNQLQDKSGRYYFKASIDLLKDQIYMSPMDLNMEQGRIQIPHKPMIRFSVSVFDLYGKRVGVLIFNYLAQQILNDLDRMNVHKGDQLILLNEDGYYLHGPEPEKKFGFMFPQTNVGFFSDHPALWKKLSLSEDHKFEQPDGIYYRRKIKPFAIDTFMRISNLHEWTLLMFVPKKNIWKRLKLLNHAVLASSAVIIPILILLGWHLGKSRTKNKWYLATLQESATKDGMTGLFNHREAMERLEYQINISKRSGHPLSICYIDLDGLKSMNDTLGHESGNQMIIAAAQSISESIRRTDIAARIGGDEFLIIFPETDNDFVRQILSRVEELYVQKGSSLFQRTLTLSWGLAVWKGDQDNIEKLINRADEDMYKMKKESGSHRR